MRYWLSQYKQLKNLAPHSPVYILKTSVTPVRNNETGHHGHLSLAGKLFD